MTAGRPPAPDLTGRVALVTGASKGIGRAYVLALAGAGAVVVGTARTLETPPGGRPGSSLDGLLEEAEAEGFVGRVHAVAGDLTSEAGIVELAARASEAAGPIDILVNNAGVYPHHDPFAVTSDQWDAVMDVNVRAPYLLIRELAPAMIERRRGSIVNLTSLSGKTTSRATQLSAHDGLMVYGVSKAALDRLTTYLSEELRPHNVAINALSPGGVLTDTWREVAPADWEAARVAGTGKEPRPEIMGPALLHLCAQDGSGITGQILHTDTFGRTWP